MTVQRTASKPEARVTATEANRHFSALLRRARAGETIAITDRGTVVARIEPAKDKAAEEAERAHRLKIWEELKQRLLTQKPLHLGKFNRDWAYDED